MQKKLVISAESWQNSLKVKFLALFFAVSKIIRNFAGGVGRTRSGRRSVMLQTCEMRTWEIFYARAVISRRAERLPRLGVGLCLHFLITGFLRTFVSELAKAVPRFCCAVEETKTNSAYDRIIPELKGQGKNTLFIIGNGFARFHGLKTIYQNFVSG